MHHADSSLVPPSITTKAQLWAHIYEQLASLLEAQRHWVTNLANASSLIYNSLLAFPSHFGPGSTAVNWCGFYIESSFFPVPRLSQAVDALLASPPPSLLLGPFCGKPACQFINITPSKARGVCAVAYLQRKTLLVPNVNEFPGHIACDGETQSEIVIPLMVPSRDEPVGVFDLDCLALNGFDEEDRKGLEKIAELIIRSTDW